MRLLYVKVFVIYFAQYVSLKHNLRKYPFHNIYIKMCFKFQKISYQVMTSHKMKSERQNLVKIQF